jgi:hypothetical protein
VALTAAAEPPAGAGGLWPAGRDEEACGIMPKTEEINCGMPDVHANDRLISHSNGGDEELSDAQREIRAEFVRRRGYWADDWQLILELAPEIMAAYTDVSAYAWEIGSLDAKTREFM